MIILLVVWFIYGYRLQLMVVSAGHLTAEMRNGYRYLRERFSGKYLALYVIMEKYLKIKIYKTITLPVVLYGCETWSLT